MERRDPAIALLLIFSAGLFATSVIAQDFSPSPEFRPSSPELEGRDQPVTDDDVEILLRAKELLADSSRWNPEDDRICDDDESNGVRSLFCALQKASIDIGGVYDHRRVALQEVRFAIMDATNVLDFEHRLRDFNNLPGTDLAAVQAVLDVALARVRARLELKH